MVIMAADCKNHNISVFSFCFHVAECRLVRSVFILHIFSPCIIDISSWRQSVAHIFDCKAVCSFLPIEVCCNIFNFVVAIFWSGKVIVFVNGVLNCFHNISVFQEINVDLVRDCNTFACWRITG